jgi:hypothetical protein
MAAKPATTIIVNNCKLTNGVAQSEARGAEPTDRGGSAGSPSKTVGSVWLATGSVTADCRAYYVAQLLATDTVSSVVPAPAHQRSPTGLCLRTDGREQGKRLLPNAIGGIDASRRRHVSSADTDVLFGRSERVGVNARRSRGRRTVTRSFGSPEAIFGR